MFPLTHLYTAERVLGYENHLTALGALFPDYGAFLGIGRNVCHEMGVDMYRYAAEHDPAHLDFAYGALTHGTALPGIDLYADEEYHGRRPGFCFQKGELIAEDMAVCCNLPETMTVWKAHNVIEMAFDILTERRCPNLGKTVLAAVEGRGEPLCVDFLEGYLRRSPEELRRMFTEVTGYFSFDGNDIEAMADKFIVSLKRRHDIDGCDRKGLIRAIGKAVAIVEPFYDDFMDETTAEISAALNRLRGAQRPSAESRQRNGSASGDPADNPPPVRRHRERRGGRARR
jgi:hypothetical protein